MILGDDHSAWEQQSGGDGHYGPEWKSEDLAAAETFYVSISDKAKVFMDLLIDHPGKLLDVDRICALRPDVFDGSSSIAGSLSGLRHAGRTGLEMAGPVRLMLLRGGLVAAWAFQRAG